MPVNRLADRDPNSVRRDGYSRASIKGVTVSQTWWINQTGEGVMTAATEAATMFALIAFGVVLLVLAAGIGLPYPQTWHSRWGNDG